MDAICVKESEATSQIKVIEFIPERVRDAKDVLEEWHLVVYAFNGIGVSNADTLNGINQQQSQALHVPGGRSR